MAESHENRIKRLIYQSWYRGCKETDQLLGHFARVFLPSATGQQLDEFEKILDEQDWDLWAWVNGSTPIPDRLKSNKTLNDLLLYCRESFAAKNTASHS